MIPFRDWLSQTTKPILKASVGVLTSLVAVLVLFSILQNQRRVEEAFQNWQRSAELLVQKRDLPTLQGVSERFLDDFAGSEFELKKSAATLWRFPMSENKRNFSRFIFNKTKKWQWAVSTEPAVIASLKIPILSIYKSTLYLCGFLVLIVLSAILFLRHLYTVIAKTLNATIDGLANEKFSGVEELDQLVMSVRSSAQLQQKTESEAIIGRMASQVAHDIASPLVALEMMVSDADELPESKRILIQSVATRVRKIINQLRHRKVEKVELAEICSLVDLVVLEKREQFRDRPGLEIKLIKDPSSFGRFSNIQPIELTRIISNLVNNSAQAIEDIGLIEVALACVENVIEISIRDNGKGIAPEVLAKLGQRGETHGKVNGAGLGLFHARSTVDGWGGTLKLTSVPGKGTVVALRFPAAAQSCLSGLHENVADKLENNAHQMLPKIILIDEDVSTHIAWQEAATKSGRMLQCLFSPELFSCYENNIEKESLIYIDLRQEERLTGLRFASQLHKKGYNNLYLLKSIGGDSGPIGDGQASFIKGVMDKAPPFLAG